jgi:hypothetical protein
MVGLVGLNSTGGFPSLQNPFAPLNQLALQQQAAGSGFAPAYASPVQLPPSQSPDAGGALSALQFQMGSNQNRPQLGATPNSATPPAQGNPQSGPANGATAASWPTTWPGLATALAHVFGLLGASGPTAPPAQGPVGILMPPPPTGQGLLG